MKRLAWCGAVLALCAASVGWGADDWRMWNTYSFKLPVIKKKVDLNGIFETRFRDDMDEFYHYHFYVGPDYYPWRWLILGMQYGNIQEGEPGEFNTEHRLMFFVTPKFKLADLGVDKFALGNLSLNLQNRLDLRIRYYKDHVYTWRYRFYPKLSYPVFKSEKLTISPYVANAFYFDLTNNIAFNQNRVYGGLSFQFSKHLSFDWYYMRLAERSGRGGNWTGSNVCGTAVAYNF